MKIQNGISLKPPTPEAAAAKQDANLKDAAKMYEKYFMNEMVKAMRSTTGEDQDGVIKKNFAEKIFSEQLDQKYVDNWSEKGGVGLADIIYTQIKERMTGEKQLPGQHMMPIAPQKGFHGIGVPGDSIQLKALPATGAGKLGYRFEVPNPSGGAFEAQAPMNGKIIDVSRLDQGWNSVRLDHGQGLTSELTFPGHVAPNVVGSEIEAGQKLGTLDPGRPVLAWNLDRKEV